MKSFFGFKKKATLTLLNDLRTEVYSKQGSLLKEYHNFLLSNNIYPSLDQEIIREKLKAKKSLSDRILQFYHKARLENERISFLEDLRAVGYDKNLLVELILEAFYNKNRPSNLWEYADLLYSIKNFRYMPQYLAIIKDSSFGSDRQMLVLLVGKSKEEYVIPVLKELLNDSTVSGHALDALSHFSGEDIACIMKEYLNSDIRWIRKIAEKYLLRHR